MQNFAGMTFVVRVDETAAYSDGSTLTADLAFMRGEGVRPIVVAPDPGVADTLVRAINRAGNAAVGLSGRDAAMLPRRGMGVGNVQAGILHTLMAAGYLPIVEPTAFTAFENDELLLGADDVAAAIAAATEAVRAIFFHDSGGVADLETAALIGELTPAEALAIAEDARVDARLRAAVRAAALGVRAGVRAAQIVDGRIAHATVIELLTAQHLGTQVTGSVFTGA